MRRSLAVIALLAGSVQVLSAQNLATITGTVRDSAGAALAGAEVILDSKRVVTTPQGGFQFDSLQVGTYLITIRLAGYAALRVRFAVRRGSWHYNYVLQPATLVLPTLRVEARRSGIYGTVGDTGLTPLAGVKVQLTGRGGGEVTTDSGGRFAFSSPVEGQYVLHIVHSGYAEERRFIELKRREGIELAIRLRPSRAIVSRADEVAVFELGSRLVMNLRNDRISASQLERFGTLGLCDVKGISARLKASGDDLTIILNGTVVLAKMSVRDLCSWQADEVDLVEFGDTVCRDVTRTLAEMLSVWCTRFNARGQGMSRMGPQSSGGPFVVIWERR